MLKQKTDPKQRARNGCYHATGATTQRVLPRNDPDRIHVAFDDHRLVANAGLLLPVTLAYHLGLGELVDNNVDLGDAPSRANAGDKFLTLVASALAGGDCIDDADALRAGETEQVLGCVIKAPSTLGTFLRSFRWEHVRQLDRVSRELLARAWAAGAGPGDDPLTIDLDSTVCETYRLAKEGAQHHNYAGQRGYHPLLAIAAGTGDVLMARLRKGRANTARGAAHFLSETISRVRHAGATGPLTMRADSGFYTHPIFTACRKMKVRFFITVRQHARLRNLIEAIPETDWTPIPYWMDGIADAAETTYVPFESKPDAATVRLIVRRVKPTRGSQLALFVNYSYHAFITDREGGTLELEADHRRHAEIENTIRDLKYGVGLNHLPSGRFAANGAWLAVQVMAHNLVWYVGMRQTDPTWVEENRGPAWSSHPILIEPEQYPWLEVNLFGVGNKIRLPCQRHPWRSPAGESVQLQQQKAVSASKSSMAQEGRPSAHRSRRGGAALSHPAGRPARVGHSGPTADRGPGGRGALQPRQRYLARPTRRLGRTLPGSGCSLHGDADRDPFQSRHQRLLPEAAGGRQAEEGGLGRLHA